MIDIDNMGKKYVLLGIVVLMVIGLIYFAWRKDAETESNLQQAIVISQQNAQDKNVLQNKLEMSKQNAEMLAGFASQAQVGNLRIRL